MSLSNLSNNYIKKGGWEEEEGRKEQLEHGGAPLSLAPISHQCCDVTLPLPAGTRASDLSSRTIENSGSLASVTTGSTAQPELPALFSSPSSHIFSACLAPRVERQFPCLHASLLLLLCSLPLPPLHHCPCHSAPGSRECPALSRRY